MALKIISKMIKIITFFGKTLRANMNPYLAPVFNFDTLDYYGIPV